MKTIGYCDYCAAKIIEYTDNYGEEKIEYTCDCNILSEDDDVYSD